MAGSITDMTDRRQAASDSAEKERALVPLASIRDGVITTDTDGWVEYLTRRRSNSPDGRRTRPAACDAGDPAHGRRKPPEDRANPSKWYA